MNVLTRSLEGLYQQMWQDFEKGAIPVPDLANLDLYHELSCEEDHEAQEMLAKDNFNGFYQYQDRCPSQIPPSSRGSAFVDSQGDQGHRAGLYGKKARELNRSRTEKRFGHGESKWM